MPADALSHLQVFDLDSTFFGKDILDFGGFDAVPSSPSDGEPLQRSCFHACMPLSRLFSNEQTRLEPI